MTKNLLIIVCVVALGALGVALFVTNKPTSPISKNPEQVTVTGTFVCLPPLDTSGPTTLECAFGLETADSERYALHTRALESGVLSEFTTGDQVVVMGTLTPRTQLDATDSVLTYDIAGVIEVNSIEGAVAETENTHVTAGGKLSFVRPKDFGLAVTAEQILVKSVIPPCAEGFDYCVYYNGTTFADTNFESAGLRIEERPDLTSTDACLTTPPAGYDNLNPDVTRMEQYATSVFAPVGDAGAGHYAVGSLYRLAFDADCYEFETRIGESQFANYPAGSIEEFTESDREEVGNMLRDVLRQVRFADNEDSKKGEIIFP